MSAGYVYVWEFVVRPEHVSSFERSYGPSGEWVSLFRRAPGYRRTELHRDRSRPERYLTIDHWESREAFEAFRERFRAEFEALDARCAEWTLSEAELGRFAPVE